MWKYYKKCIQENIYNECVIEGLEGDAYSHLSKLLWDDENMVTLIALS